MLQADRAKYTLRTVIPAPRTLVRDPAGTVDAET